MRSIGASSLSLLLVVTAMAALANEAGPVVEITPGRARAFRVGVQIFAQPEASEGELSVPGDFAHSLRTQIEAGLTFSSVVLPLDHEAFLSTQATEKMGSGPRLDCPDWSQSGAEAWLEGEIRAASGRFIVTYQLWDAARCTRLSAETVSGGVADVPRMGREIADEVVGLMTGTRGASSTEIAFISNRSGSTEVFVMDVFGGHARAATRGATLKSSPSWMREGSAVLYTSFRHDGLAGLYRSSRGRGVRPGPFSGQYACGSPEIPGGRIAQGRLGGGGLEYRRRYGNLPGPARRQRSTAVHEQPRDRRGASLGAGRQEARLCFRSFRLTAALRQGTRNRIASADYLPGQLQYVAGLVAQRALDRVRNPDRRPGGYLDGGSHGRICGTRRQSRSR